MHEINYSHLIEIMREEITQVMEKEKIIGLAIALIDEDKIIWSEGFGYTGISKKEKITADTLFSTQSMGKTVAATAFMILASKGLIALDDPIRKYYPEFVVNTKFGDRDKEIEKITFRRMLSHFAGFVHEAGLGNNYDSTPCTFDEHIASIANTWLRSPVGIEYSYANNGFDLTAFVLGKIMNKSYPEVVKDELFKPLGIVKATFNVKEAQQHFFAKGTIGEFEPSIVQIPMLGAGGVYISVNEQAKFAMLHLNEGKVNGKQLITKENFQEMYKTQFKEDGIDSNYSLGIYKEFPINGDEVFCHGGGGYGYQTQHAWIPNKKIAAIVFTNSSNHNGEQVKLARKALELMSKEKSKPAAVSVDLESLKKLQGTYYKYRIGMRNLVVDNGKLIAFGFNGEEDIFYPQSALEFLTKDLMHAKFVLDEQEKPKAMKLQLKSIATTLRFNDSTNDEFGPNKKSWEKYRGIYELSCYGLKTYIAIAILNGYLYLIGEEKYRLEEYQNDLFFTMDAEALYLGEGNQHFGNRPLTKIDMNTNQLLEECKSNKDKIIGYKTSFNNISNILYWSDGFQVSFDFLLQAIDIDQAFKDTLRSFGYRLYAFRELDKALKCFEKCLEIDDNDLKSQDMLKRIKQE
ncbi:MAG: serine hydrolase [Candidatus Thorarchaeota archaeon]